MRKIQCFVAALCCMLSSSIYATVYSGNCGAEGDGSNLQWSFNTETGVLDITGSGAMAGYYGKTPGWGPYKSSVTQINLPYGLTKIGDSAFRETNITTLTIPNTVTEIVELAFHSCPKLQSVSFSNSLETIGYAAFDYCSELKAINLPNSLVTIGSHAFQSCIGLINVAIPNSVKTIGSYAFEDCTGLISVTIGTGVEIINDNAFSGCTGLTAVYITDLKKWCEIDFPNDNGGYISTGNPLYYANKLYLNGQLITDLIIPNGITEIKGRSFCNATCFETLVIPSGVTSIRKGAFYGCDGLTNITISNTVSIIETAAFYNCKQLPAVVIPGSVKTIENNAFTHCTALNDIQLSEGIETIGQEAFSNCSTLVSITIPESVKTMGYRAFTSCIKLSSITWNAIHCADYTNDNLFYYCESMTIGPNVEYIPKNLCNGSSKLKEIIIPDNVQEIGSHAFYNCISMTKAKIGNHVEKIGDRAFYQCSKLDTVIVPNSVMDLGIYTFNGCKLLKHLVLPNQLTQIGENLCNGCSVLETITIPATVQTIGQKAFYDCKKLKVITCEAVNLPACGTTIFGNVDKSTPLYVPAASVEAYRAADQWKDFTDIRPIGDIYRVTFVDWDGSELSAVYVDGGQAATAPADPTREGYTFKSWDKPFDNVTEYMTVTAQYDINRFEVKFVDWNNEVLKVDNADWHGAAVAPENPTRPGYTFTGWDKAFDDVTKNLEVKAKYTINYYDVFFLSYDGQVLKEQSVKYNTSAKAPTAPVRDGYTFKAWSANFSAVIDRMFIVALYEKNQTGAIPVRFVDKEGATLLNSYVLDAAPEAPIVADYTFLRWQTMEADINSGITIQATYEENPNTSVQNVGVSKDGTIKMLKQGQLFILRNGETYNAQGARVE